MVRSSAREKLVDLAQKLVQTESLSGEEEEIAKLLAATMKDRNYDEVLY